MNESSGAREVDGLKTTEGQALPLEGVEVTGEVLGGHARVHVVQKYRNTEKRAVEAIYTFPLPGDATLVSFAMTCAGRRLEGVVKERDEAFEDYDEAITHGHGAALLEQERPNVFTAQVGNLLEGEETTIDIEYVQRIQVDEGALRWTIPTLVAPRYIPGQVSGDRTAHGISDPTDRVPDADRISPPLAKDVPYGLKLDLAFQLGRDVEVESPSHAIVVTRHDGKVRASFAQREVALDRDVVINLRHAKDETLSVVTAHCKSGETGTFALTLVPDLFAEAKDARQEVVFLIDTSGSMDGASIIEAREALRLSLRHLREGDRFTIVSFNSSYETFSESLVPFTQKTLERADAWVRALQANGGTEILAPLLWATKLSKDSVIVLLTDAEVGNEDEIRRRVLEERGKSRIYSFGIGTNVNDALLRELARTTGGAVEFIHPGERLDEKVVAQFARALAARVTDVRVEFDMAEGDKGAPSDLAPSEAPALVDGEPWVLLGRYETPGVGRVHVRGTLRDKPFHLEVTIDLPAESELAALPKLWAAERIREWDSASLDPRRQKAMKERIAKLAVEHGIASRYTAFVVVEKREGARKMSAQPEARVVPVNLPAGWAMFDQKKTVPPQVMNYAMAQAGAFTGAPPPAPRQAPPAPSAMRPMAPPAPSPARSGGIGAAFGKVVDRARAVFEPKAKGAKADDEGASYGFLEEAEAAPMADGYADLATGSKAESADPIVELLGRQLASGLWTENDKSDDETLVSSTSRALLELLRAGVNTSHKVHGEQVRKAIEALIALAEKIAPRDPKAAELALGVAWLLASGRRTRKHIEDAIGKTRSLDALRAQLGDERAMRKHVDQLAANA